MATIDDIISRAQQVRDNTAIGSNTATLVGGVMVDTADHLKDVEDDILSLQTDVSALQSQDGFYTCATVAGTEAKKVYVPNFVLSTGARLKIKFTYSNSNAAPTLIINNTIGPYPLFYGGVRASNINTWCAGEVVDTYFDGTNWMLTGDLLYQKRVSTPLVQDFVPKCGVNCGNPARNVVVLKTPYKFSDNYDYIFAIGISATSTKDTNLTISFWGRNNSTFNYYSPVVNYDRPIISVPIRLCTDSNGYICIVLGEDDASIVTYVGTNPYVYIKNVVVRGLTSTIPAIIEDGWTATLADSLSTSDYSNVYSVNSDNKIDEKIASDVSSAKTELLGDVNTAISNINGCVALTNQYVRLTPLVSYYLNNSEAVESKIKVFLPQLSSGGVYTVGLRIDTLDSDLQRGNWLSEAKIKFWRLTNSRIDYGVCFCNLDFPCRVRVGNDGDAMYLLLDGEFPRYSRVILTEHSGSKSSPYTMSDYKSMMDDFVFSTFAETDLANFTALHTPKVHVIPDVSYVEGLLDGVSEAKNTNIPQKFKSFVIFGSSKSTSRNVFSNWIEFYLAGLLGKANITTLTNKTGTTMALPTNGKIYSNKDASTLKNRINGVGSTLEFYIYGDHVDIVQFIRRTNDFAEFDIYDNDVKIGTYENRNKTMSGTKTMSFTGDGSQKSFVLDDLDSYNFVVTVGGVSKNVSMNPALNDADADCYAVRTIMTFSPYDDGEPRRILYFPTAPANNAVISVSYDMGHAIGFIQSDYNESNTESNENTNPVSIASLTADAVYKNGYPLSPIVMNWESVIRLSFDKYGSHKIKISITGGTNPYFCFDFACAELNGFMNAAFGGYDLPRALSEPQWHDWRCVRYMPNFDSLILEYGTNDDRFEIDRVFVHEEALTYAQLQGVRMKDVKYITNENNTSFKTGLCTGTIDSITSFTITSDEIKTSDIEVGDYVKIGRYHSDWREIAVRKITAVDKANGVITWAKPFRASSIWHYKDFTDLVGAEFSVRRLGQIKDRYSQLIEKFRLTNPTAHVYIVGMSAFNNNDYCSAWGYDEAFMDIAAEYGATYINIANEQVRYNDGALSDITAITLSVTSTGATDYTIPKSSVPNDNRAFRVLVNGEDVTGIDAYVERTDGWYLTSEIPPADIHLTDSDNWNVVTTFATDYGSGDIKIHFYGSVPTADDTIQLLVGGYGWSDDGVHQVDAGNQVYGSCILKATM